MARLRSQAKSEYPPSHRVTSLPYLPWSAGRSLAVARRPGPGHQNRTGKAEPMTRIPARAAVFLVTLAFGCTALGSTALGSTALGSTALGRTALGSTALGSTTAAAAAANSSASGRAASGWLARQLVDGSHFVTVFDGVTYPNQGETIDAIFAFAATKTASSYGAKAIRWLERPSVLSNYIGSGADRYAGATAKLALAAEVAGINPARFGKVNLIARLDSLIVASGRYSDRPLNENYSNAFSQALAIIALSRYSHAPVRAVRFLISSECKNGGFPLDFGQPTCASDTDSTAMAVQALLAAGQRAPAVRGLTWLKHVQLKNGGLDASGATTPNANTTGLAGEAFAAARWYHNAALAATFLRSLQAGCSAKSSRRGAIAYDSSGFAESTAVDATAQGILGLADVSLAKISASGSSSGAPRLECAA
jgi:hypothetical protein